MKKLISRASIIFVLSFGVLFSSHAFIQSGLAAVSVNNAGVIQLCDGSDWEWVF